MKISNDRTKFSGQDGIYVCDDQEKVIILTNRELTTTREQSGTVLSFYTYTCIVDGNTIEGVAISNNLNLQLISDLDGEEGVQEVPDLPTELEVGFENQRPQGPS